MTNLLTNSLILPLILTAQLLAAATGAELDLVTVKPGDCPILLTSPHGGQLPVPGVEDRRGDGISQFATVRDMRTDKLTEQIANELQQLEYGRPYIVIARFTRKHIDANRPADGAFENELARKYYNAYHAAIHAARDEIVEKWGRGLLLDIHGTSAEPSTIFRGTQDGKTVEHLTNRFGDDALRGATSLFGQFSANGFAVDPPVGSTQQESRRHRGGYTVRTYGSSDGGTIDAIQLELGAKLRERSNLNGTARGVARAVAKFASTYLPKTHGAKRREEQATSDDRTFALLVPAYSYPTGEGLEFWNKLIEAASRVPIVVIANPNNGPGAQQDENYSKVIARAQATGIRVVGYVATGYARRELAEVKRDVDRWKTLYSNVEGVFFDEQSSSADDIGYYRDLSGYARAAFSNSLLVANPGTECAEAYLTSRVFDVICIFENGGSYDSFLAPSVTNLAKHMHFAGLLHSQANPNVALSNLHQAAEKNLSYFFVTDDERPNPWDKLPSYWDREVAAIEQMNGQRSQRLQER